MTDSASALVTEETMALLTDLYELTMAQSYFSGGCNEVATFDLFVRNLPPRRGFLVSAGLDTVLAYLGRLRFSDNLIDYLRTLDLFDGAFLGYLRQFAFTGDVRPIPEGELVFPPNRCSRSRPRVSKRKSSRLSC